jgi:hypothetical protein
MAATATTTSKPTSFAAKGPMWADLSPAQRDCIKDKWAKSGDAIIEAAKGSILQNSISAKIFSEKFFILKFWTKISTQKPHL